jgi:hypothetical protein
VERLARHAQKAVPELPRGLALADDAEGVGQAERMHGQVQVLRERERRAADAQEQELVLQRDRLAGRDVGAHYLATVVDEGARADVLHGDAACRPGPQTELRS